MNKGGPDVCVSLAQCTRRFYSSPRIDVARAALPELRPRAVHAGRAAMGRADRTAPDGTAGQEGRTGVTRADTGSYLRPEFDIHT